MGKLLRYWQRCPFKSWTNVAITPLTYNTSSADSGRDGITPDRVAPDRVTPDRVTPDRVAPDRVAPDRVAPDRVAQNAQISETVRRERSRLSDFIRRRLPDPDAAEDILQDVFYELTEAYRLTKPIERVASWLFAVARHKISDWYRRPKAVSLTGASAGYEGEEEDAPMLTDFLPADDDGPEGAFFRETFLEALDEALDELPPEQREVFVRHEIDGQSFKVMADELGVPVNTLLSRKRYAVLHLRERLQDLYDELMD